MGHFVLGNNLMISEALLYSDETQKVKVNVLLISARRVTSTAQNNYLSPGFTFRFAFRQSKATDPSSECKNSR